MGVAWLRRWPRPQRSAEDIRLPFLRLMPTVAVRMKRLTRSDSLAALNALSEELGTQSGRHEVLIAGGAAMVLLYGARDSTKDVDAVFSSSAVRDAASRVATRMSLPLDWLNDGVKGYLHGRSLGNAVLDTPSLSVKTLAVEQLLAMKLSAWRDDVDISDAVLLLSKLEGGKTQIWRSVARYLVPGRELKAQLAFDDLWEAREA